MKNGDFGKAESIVKLSRTDYFKKQKEIGILTEYAEKEASRRIRAITRELVLPLVADYARTGFLVYPTEELAKQIDLIIREEAAKPVTKAQNLQEDMEQSLQEKLDILVSHSVPEENEKVIRLQNARKPAGSIVKTKGRALGYRRDPITGNIIWDDLPLEYEFKKRANLSQLVWDAVEEQEENVLGVIHGGRALGRNVKDISKDLEIYINYHDGGAKVAGRWGKMFPNTEQGRKDALKHQYLKEHGGLQYGIDAAKALLRQDDAKKWVKQKMAETTQRGTPRLPSAVAGYARRLGAAGLDHRAIRIARTETTAMVADEQLKIAGNSDICTGEMDFVMERGRDHWNCNCEKYASMNPWKVDDPDRPDIPVHPNCMCEWRPRLKTDQEIVTSFKEKMAEELGIVEGTLEKQEMLDKIDRGMCPYCGKAFNAKKENSDKCPVCGKSSGKIGDTNGITTITSVREIDFNDSKAVRREINIFLNKFSNDEIEHSVVVSKSGKIYELNGNSFRVDTQIIGEDELIGSIGAHNHPVPKSFDRGDSFSLDDLLFTAKYKTGKETLTSGNRRDAFEYTGNLSNTELKNIWYKTKDKVNENAFNNKTVIEWEQEEICRELSKTLEGFKFYENI